MKIILQETIFKWLWNFYNEMLYWSYIKFSRVVKNRATNSTAFLRLHLLKYEEGLASRLVPSFLGTETFHPQTAHLLLYKSQGSPGSEQLIIIVYASITGRDGSTLRRAVTPISLPFLFMLFSSNLLDFFITMVCSISEILNFNCPFWLHSCHYCPLILKTIRQPLISERCLAHWPFYFLSVC